MFLVNETTNLLTEEESYKFECWAFLLSVVIGFGLFGNIFGLISIYHAKSNEKYHFKNSWNSSTLFFFNLVVVDLVYCMFLVAKGVHALLIYLKVDDDLVNEKECQFFVLGGQTFANIGGWCMMSIVFTQAIPKIR